MKDDFKPARRAKTPEASADTKTIPKQPAHHVDIEEPAAKRETKVKVRMHKRVHWWLKSLSRKQFIAVIILFFLISGGAAFGTWRFGQKDFKEAAAIVPDVPEPIKPVTIASKMTGRQIAPELNTLPVTAVMIENSPEARPQSGLQEADLVFEAIAEGGITRFVALYQESKPAHIGPVRSVRPYYLDFIVPYGASLAHAGGSADALAQIRSQGIKDLDHGANGSTYQRVSNRYSPHNLYTTREKLLELQNKKGFTAGNYQGFPRKADTPVTPTARSVDLTISSFLYNPRFDYDAATNSYKRSMGGKPHVDEKTGQQIAPKVVVALVSPHRYSGIYSVYQVSGSGSAVIFQDGAATAATWTKSNRGSEYVFKDAAGVPIPFNAGQAWISLVGSAGAIKFAP